MTYGYARVSTVKQKKDGNSLEEQMEKLKEFGCNDIIVEAYSGKTMDRPAFRQLKDKLKTGDMLVVTKLDRFARTTVEGIETIKELRDRGVKVYIGNMGLIEDTHIGNLILTILLAFAEYERNIIFERTQCGKAVAKANPGWKDGRKPKDIDMDLFKKLYRKNKNRKITVKECCEELGISESTWNRMARKVA